MRYEPDESEFQKEIGDFNENAKKEKKKETE
jgi:hypothetical protein